MKFGLTPQQYEFVLQNVVIPLRQEGAEVYCFGSRARETHRQFSDLDLMVEGEGKALNAKIGAIRENLVESNFPYKVDLVLFSEFADSFKPGYLQDKKLFK